MSTEIERPCRRGDSGLPRPGLGGAVNEVWSNSVPGPTITKRKSPRAKCPSAGALIAATRFDLE